MTIVLRQNGLRVATTTWAKPIGQVSGFGDLAWSVSALKAESVGVRVVVTWNATAWTNKNMVAEVWQRMAEDAKIRVFVVICLINPALSIRRS